MQTACMRLDQVTSGEGNRVTGVGVVWDDETTIMFRNNATFTHATNITTPTEPEQHMEDNDHELLVG